MIAIVTCGLIAALLILLVRWIASAPLVQTLSSAIDMWADSVHSSDAGPIR